MAAGVDEVGDLLKILECDGLLEGVVWWVGVEFIPVSAIVANKVGDSAEGVKQNGVLEVHGLVRRIDMPVNV